MRHRQPLQSCYAIDLEFVKCSAMHYCRSIAFVPFSAALTAPRRPPGATTDDESPPPPRRTLFESPPTVVGLRPSEVMRLADLLPCGHELLPLLTGRLLAGPDLDALKADLAAAAGADMAAYHETRAALRELRRGLKQEARAQEGKDGPNAGEAPPTAVSKKGMTPAEVLLQKELQIRQAVTAHYDLLDPYSVPNVRRLTDTALLRQLYDAPLESSAFAAAVVYLSPLRAYGKGRGGRKALGFLLRYHPAFLQALLRRSFAGSAEMVAFLEECAGVVAAALEATAASCRSGEYPLLTNTITGNISSGTSPPSLRYVECASLEELSSAISCEWAGLLHGGATHRQQQHQHQHRQHQAGGAAKFFAYGNADARVLHSTLQLSCAAQFPPDRRSLYGARAMAAGGGGSDGGGGPMSAVPSDRLVSPFQARVTDLTAHTLFAASGFLPQVRRVPSLGAAIEKASATDATAAEVWAIQRPHDPLWDAQALACVCVAAGVVR